MRWCPHYLEDDRVTITARPYRDERDLEAMRRLLMSAGREADRAGYLHVGDVVWRLWDTLIAYDLWCVVEVWEGDAGNLIGFALHYPMYAGFNLQVHPGHRGGKLEERMLARTERRARRLARHEGHAGAIDAWDVFEEDADRIALLRRRGFVRRSDNVYYLAARSLSASIPAPELLAGYVIRGLGGDEDAAERVSHRPEVTTERYKEFMRTPGYESELDLVAEAPDGRFGAYCICWLDQANGIGLLEPVGTRPGFRRHRLAKAVVLEGLRRMNARGTHTAVVCFEGENDPARRLYESVGFGVRSTIYTYTKGA
jgi:ribosomal protein S18 acetylase RimI-like enzyme